MIDDHYIEREITLDGKKIVARYHPYTGEFHFGKSSLIGTDTTPTNAGAFRTIAELTKSFSDTKIPIISYSSADTSLKRAITKDKFYSRALEKLGYKEKETGLSISWLDTAVELTLKKLGVKFRETPRGFRYDSLAGSWFGPKRVWIKPLIVDESQQSLESKLPSTTALVALISSLFFISSNFTGNAIANLSQNFANLFGVILFIIGVTGTYFYIKKKK